MARGNDAKAWVTQKIIECFGQDRVILSDKKIYITTKENGEPIQVCLSLTCPKTMVGAAAAEAVASAKAGIDFGTFRPSVAPGPEAAKTGIDFDAFGLPAAPAPETYKPAEITPEERQTVQDLMRQLGL